MAHYIEKDWEAHGFRCIALAYKDMGHRCGYVGLPPEHPLYGKNYNEATPEIVFRVHGGLTFADNDSKYPVEGSNLWWFGFDCGHSGDAPDPTINAEAAERRLFVSGTIRSLDYVVAECESLAKQLKEVS